MSERRQTVYVDVSALDLEDGWDADLDQATVDKLQETIDQNPPVLVMPAGEAFRLVLGRHRLKAAMNAGHPSVWAEVQEPAGPASLRMQQIAENLHRCTPQGAERRALIAEYVKLASEAAAERVLGKVSRNPKTASKPRGGRPKSKEKAVREQAAKAAGVTERTVRNLTAEPTPSPIPKPPTFKSRVRSAMVAVDELAPTIQALADETREQAQRADDSDDNRNPSAPSIVLVHSALDNAARAVNDLSGDLQAAITEMERIESVLRQAGKPTSERERRRNTILLGHEDGSETVYEPDADTEVEP